MQAHPIPAHCHAQDSRLLGADGLDLSLSGEWIWLGEAGGESRKDLAEKILIAREGIWTCSVRGQRLPILQMAHSHPNDYFILYSGSGVTLSLMDDESVLTQSHWGFIECSNMGAMIRLDLEYNSSQQFMEGY